MEKRKARFIQGDRPEAGAELAMTGGGFRFLPRISGNQRPRRGVWPQVFAGEQRFQTLGSGVDSAMHLVAMDAGADEQRVEPLPHGARDVGAHAVADGQRPRRFDRPAQRRLRGRQRRAVDRRIGLAGVNRLAAQFLIAPGERARAVDQRRAPMDDEVGIGADERQAARGYGAQPTLVILRRLDVVVEQAGAENIGGVVGGGEFRPRAGPRLDRLEQREVAARPDMETG